MRFKIHPEYAARQFELQDPRSKDSLISWIQLNDPTHPAPKSVLNFVGRYAFGFLRNSDATQVADTGNLVRLTAAFFGCLLCTLIYFFASPKSGLTSTARMLMPWANIAPATRVQFTQVTPASTTIMQGSSIPPQKRESLPTVRSFRRTTPRPDRPDERRNSRHQLQARLRQRLRWISPTPYLFDPCR